MEQKASNNNHTTLFFAILIFTVGVFISAMLSEFIVAQIAGVILSLVGMFLAYKPINDLYVQKKLVFIGNILPFKKPRR